MEESRADASRNPARPGRTVSTTCQGCKRAKVACTGGDPSENRSCTRCARLNIPCTWGSCQPRSNTKTCTHCRLRKVACRQPNGISGPCQAPQDLRVSCSQCDGRQHTPRNRLHHRYQLQRWCQLASTPATPLNPPVLCVPRQSGDRQHGHSHNHGLKGQRHRLAADHSRMP